MRVYALGPCHPDCRFCAREFWVWLRARMAQMDRVKKGMTTSWSQAAATSVRAP